MASSVPLMADVEGMAEESEESLKNDFAYNNNVLGAAKHVRMGFLRKVYGLLSVQLALTTLIAGVCMFQPVVTSAIRSNPWLIMVAFILSIGLLVALQIKRKETPINLILLAAFTVVEAYTVGVIVTFYDASVVVQAFFLTFAVVAGLTVFTLQSKRDFSSWGTGLYAGIWTLILGGFIHVFVGGEILHTLLAVAGALLFSGFIVFDTYLIMKKMSPEEYIVATIQLYLDIINLFIEILKILDKVNRR